MQINTNNKVREGDLSLHQLDCAKMATPQNPKDKGVSNVLCHLKIHFHTHISEGKLYPWTHKPVFCMQNHPNLTKQAR